MKYERGNFRFEFDGERFLKPTLRNALILGFGGAFLIGFVLFFIGSIIKLVNVAFGPDAAFGFFMFIVVAGLGSAIAFGMLKDRERMKRWK